MRRAGFIVRLVLAAVLGGTAPGPAVAQSTTPDHKTVVKLGVTGRPDQAPLELALRRGYFEQQGIEIQTVQANVGMEFVSALAADQIQVTSGSPNAGLFNALNRGIDIRLVANFAHVGDARDGAVSIIVRSDLVDSGAVKTVADLKGRTINAGAGGRGQYPDVLFQKMLAMNKMTMEDVKFVYITFADSMAALASKSIDAAFMVEPLVTMAERQNTAKILLRAGEIDPGAQLSVVLYSPNFAQQREVATKYMVAYLHGVRDYYEAFFLKKDRDATITLLTQTLPVKDPAIWANAMPQYTDLNGRIDVADLKRQAALYKEQGNITGAVPDLDKFVDPSFAEAAVKILGGPISRAKPSP
jgi:NitT/TauT family transport system substrate-binding protein